MGRRQLGRHRVLMSTQLRTGVDEIRLEVLDVLHELGVLRAQGLRVVLRVRKGSEQRARLGRVLLLHRLERRLVFFVLWRGRPRLRTRQRDRRRRSRLCRSSGARCARGRGRRIVARRRFRVRHRARHAPAAPRARDRARFRHRDSTGGKRTLIAVAEAAHAPKARPRAVGVMIEQAGGSERLGCTWAEPFHGAGPR